MCENPFVLFVAGRPRALQVDRREQLTITLQPRSSTQLVACMSTKPSYHTHLNTNTLDLTAFTNLLKQEYADLIETSVALRKDSRQLVEDSQLLRTISIRLLLSSNSKVTRRRC